MIPEQLAKRFHESYERLAPSFGYETRKDTRAFDEQTQNGRLMIAVCAEMAPLVLSLAPRPGEWVEQAKYDAVTTALKAERDALKSQLESAQKDAERLREALNAIYPAARHILWCALVWNDHNFHDEALHGHGKKAAEALGSDRRQGVDAVNAWMARIDAALASQAVPR